MIAGVSHSHDKGETLIWSVEASFAAGDRRLAAYTEVDNITIVYTGPVHDDLEPFMAFENPG